MRRETIMAEPRREGHKRPAAHGPRAVGTMGRSPEGWRALGRRLGARLDGTLDRLIAYRRAPKEGDIKEDR